MGGIYVKTWKGIHGINLLRLNDPQSLKNIH